MIELFHMPCHLLTFSLRVKFQVDVKSYLRQTAVKVIVTTPMTTQHNTKINLHTTTSYHHNFNVNNIIINNSKNKNNNNNISAEGGHISPIISF